MNNKELQEKEATSETDQCPEPSTSPEPISAVSPESAAEQQDASTGDCIDTDTARADQPAGTRQSNEQPLDRLLHLSRSDGGSSNTTLERWEITFQELCKQLQRQPDVGGKDGAYYVRGPAREDKPSRADANIEYASLLVIDGDSSIDPETGEITEGAPPPDSVHKALVELDIAHVVYSTYSNGQPDKGNRYRTLIPATVADKPELEACLDLQFDQLHRAGCWLADVKENRAWSQAWYFPRLASGDAEYLFYSHETGQAFDVPAAVDWHQARSPIPAEELEEATSKAVRRDPNSAFDLFNDKYNNPEWMLSVLTEQGYTLEGTSYINGETAYRLLSPHSTSGNAGIILFHGKDGVWRVYSHHNADEPLSRTGEDASTSDAWDLFRLFDHEGDDQQALTAWQQELDERPVIHIAGGQVAPNLEATVKGLADQKPPSVYQRAQSLCRVAHLEETVETQGCSIPQGTAHIVQLQRAGLTVEVSKAIRWESYKKKAWRQVDPCPKVVGALLEAVGDWTGIPSLVGISEAPILRADGTLLAESGYDEPTRLYVEGRFPAINLPDQISLDDAKGAAELLLEHFCEFPFVDEQLDRSATLAYMLTLALRPQLPTAPLFCISATTPGTGKGLLVEACNLLIRGRDAATMPPVQGAGGEEEMRKRITALLSAGLSSANLDNCTKAIGGESLNATLTATDVTDRVLGTSRLAKMPNKMTLVATGNNLSVRGDMTRRSLVIQLDAGVERPELRKFSEKNLPGRILKDRGALLTAIFTILKGYQQAGSPGAQMDLLGRFEAWTAAVCGPIRWLGYPDPLETQQRLREQDPEADKLEMLLSAWYDQRGEKWTTVAELIESAIGSGNSYISNGDLAPDLYGTLVEVASDGREKLNRNMLGWYLRHFTGRIAGGYRLEKKPRTSQKSKNPQQYRVICLIQPEDDE